MQLLKNCISPTIRIGQESWCLQYAGFLLNDLKKYWPYLVYGQSQDTQLAGF